MRRYFELVQDSRNFFAILVIGLWLTAPSSLASAGPDLFDGLGQQETAETDALSPGAETHRAKRQLSLQAHSVTTGADSIGAAAVSAQSGPKMSSRTTVKIYRLTEVYLC